MDFSNYKFHCSSLGKLMVLPRSKKAREAGELSKTTESYLMEVFIQEAYGRKYEIHNKFLEKGNFAEEDSLDLVTKNRKKLYVKNKKQLENDYITGTPDIILQDEVIDIKTKWDLLGFAKEKGDSKDYFWQLQGYMWLTEKIKAELIYTLVNTPEFLINREKTKVAYNEMIPDSSTEMVEMEKRIEHLMMFDDIEPEKRMKVFEFEFKNEEIELLKMQIERARNYLNSLSL